MKTNLAKSSYSEGRRSGGALKLLAVAVAVALMGVANTAKAVSYTLTLVKVSGGVQIGNGTDVAIKPAPTGKITIPAKIGKFAVKAIAPNAFKGCTGLTAVAIPSSVTRIGDSAFSASGLTSVSVPGNVKTIGNNAFSECTSLKAVDLAPGVVSIGERAFFHCFSIGTFAIPNSLASMGASALFGAFASDPSVDREIWYESVGDDVRIKQMIKDSGGGYNNIDFYLRCKLTVKPNSTKYGTATVGGTTKSSIWEFAENGNTITAKPKKGHAFVGWFSDKACKTPLDDSIIYSGGNYRQKTLVIIMPKRHVTIYAKFITKAQDKKALKFSAATKKLAKTATKFTAGEGTTSIQVSASSATTHAYSVKGLPAGLTINKTTGEISGTVTRPGTFTATVTVKSAAGNKISQKVKIAVYAPTWVRGAYEGVALPGTKSSDPPAHLKFTVGATGKISGSVNYKGKAYSFTAQCAYCYLGIMRFVPSIKVGKTTFKPGTVTVGNQILDGRERSAASCDSGRFLAYKSYNLVAAGGRAEVYVGKSFTLTGDHDVSGLPPGNVDLRVAFGSGDKVVVSGKVNGKKVSLSTQMCLKKTSVDNNTFATTYEMYADIIFPNVKYYRTLKLKFICDAYGGCGLGEPELARIDAMWN